MHDAHRIKRQTQFTPFTIYTHCLYCSVIWLELNIQTERKISPARFRSFHMSVLRPPDAHAHKLRIPPVIRIIINNVTNVDGNSWTCSCRIQEALTNYFIIKYHKKVCVVYICTLITCILTLTEKNNLTRIAISKGFQMFHCFFCYWFLGI